MNLPKFHPLAIVQFMQNCILHGLVHCTGVCVMCVHLLYTYHNNLTNLSLQKPGKRFFIVLLTLLVYVQLDESVKSLKLTTQIHGVISFNRSTLSQRPRLAGVWRYTFYV